MNLPFLVHLAFACTASLHSGETEGDFRCEGLTVHLAPTARFLYLIVDEKSMMARGESPLVIRDLKAEKNPIMPLHLAVPRVSAEKATHDQQTFSVKAIKAPTRSNPHGTKPEWQKQLEEQMKKRISFDFVNTPIVDVVAFVTNLTGTGCSLDPKAVGKDDLPITLKAVDMKLRHAMDLIMDQAGLVWRITRAATARDIRHWKPITITSRDRQMPVLITRVFDCRKLIRPGTEMQLLQTIQALHPAAEWEKNGLLLRFIEGRLVVRNEQWLVREVDRFMNEFSSGSNQSKTLKDPAK
ncbi:MAG: hypothetical protein QGF00_03470 [Planctomycetota bacterium]|jgi:hypothetical protein|nr:hypothetical protein [Planctomycetota bacterium]MDP7248637.1 hypothetical protein [Planctomycetota bacterium]